MLLRHYTLIVLAAVTGAIGAGATEARTVWLGELDLSAWRQVAPAQRNLSVLRQPMLIAGQKFDRGVGVHANSSCRLVLNGGCTRFRARVGVDDIAAGPASVIFQIIGDDRMIYDSGVVAKGSPPREIDIDLSGIQMLLLSCLHGGEAWPAYDHGDWADARFTVTGPPPVPFVAPPEKPYLLTPPPGPAPRLNTPKVYGARPGNPFLLRLAAQGARPMNFSAEGLPAGIELDAAAGILRGTTPPRGNYLIILKARNSHGTDTRQLRLVAGDKLALTPPMGWNDWYAYTNRVTDWRIREAADAMLSQGMADVGYDYVGLDDCWMRTEKEGDPQQRGPFRDADGRLLPNAHFPDMRALTDYLHARGLKAGIYSSPGELTCGGFAGSWGHEAEDVRQFAAWGFDLLKYDWCSYRFKVANPPSLEEMQQPYRIVGRLLQGQPRDILFNLCQYGIGDVWKWGRDVGGQSWRTAGDLGHEFNRFFAVVLKNAEHGKWQGPGAWNDPDYIPIGFRGGAKPGEKGPTFPYSPTEQYSIMSLWSLMAAPLFFGGDPTQLDEFTLNVLCNREVIEVDQDPLGECARVVKFNEETFLMLKRLEDGSHALGLCNASDTSVQLTARWKDLGLAETQSVRDLWRQRDLGDFKREFSATAPRRGVVLVRLKAVP